MIKPFSGRMSSISFEMSITLMVIGVSIYWICWPSAFRGQSFDWSPLYYYFWSSGCSLWWFCFSRDSGIKYYMDFIIKLFRYEMNMYHFLIIYSLWNIVKFFSPLGFSSTKYVFPVLFLQVCDKVSKRRYFLLIILSETWIISL